MTPEVSVVVGTYNGPEWVERCLQALLVDARPEVATEVVVEDSGSGPETREVLARWADHATVLLQDENVGFARGCTSAAGWPGSIARARTNCATPRPRNNCTPTRFRR